MYIQPQELHEVMQHLRNKEQMDFLESLTGMDWGIADEKDSPEKLRGLGVVYHLESTITGERIALQTATANREQPELPSVSDIWKIADFYEREVYDFYGIIFVGHPDMRRLYLRNDWVGHPMRKDNDPEKDNPLCMTNEETFDTTQEIELNSDGTIKNKETKLFGEEEYIVNIGPQHPATHGVMRFRVSLEGEIIRKIDANCGYIHRGIAKVLELLTRLPLNLHTGDVLRGELVSILSTLRGEKEREITEVAQTDFLALEQHLTHAVYGDVEDCADVGSRINTTMRGDVLGKLLDGHDVGVL